MLRRKYKNFTDTMTAVFFSTLILSIPALVLAQGIPPIPAPGGGGGNVIQNPIGATTFQQLLTNVITYLLGLVGLLSLLALIAGGLYLIIGFGNEDRIKRGKTIITWAIIGLVIVLISYAVVYTVGVLIF